MNAGIAEILGMFLVVIGCGTVVAAASMISVALAVLTAGALLVLGGVLVVYVAAVMGRKPEGRTP